MYFYVLLCAPMCLNVSQKDQKSRTIIRLLYVCELFIRYAGCPGTGTDVVAM